MVGLTPATRTPGMVRAASRITTIAIGTFT